MEQAAGTLKTAPAESHDPDHDHGHGPHHHEHGHDHAHEQPEVVVDQRRPKAIPTSNSFLLRIPRTGFSCKDRAPGYYADMEADCQVRPMAIEIEVFS